MLCLFCLLIFWKTEPNDNSTSNWCSENEFSVYLSEWKIGIPTPLLAAVKADRPAFSGSISVSFVQLVVRMIVGDDDAMVVRDDVKGIL